MQKKTFTRIKWGAIGASVAFVAAVLGILQFFGVTANLFVAQTLEVEIAEDELVSLSGFPLLDHPAYGKVYTGGVRARLALQAGSEDSIIQIHNISISAEKIAVKDPKSLAYRKDPDKIPGLGTARPLVYNITVAGEGAGQIFFVGEDDILQADYPDLLALDPPLVINLDRSSGLQESIVANIRPSAKGLFEIRFDVSYVIKGEVKSIKTNAFRVFQ